MVAAEANQWIARLHRALHIPLDEIPRIAGTVELDVAMIHNSAGGTQIEAGFAPTCYRRLSAIRGG